MGTSVCRGTIWLMVAALVIGTGCDRHIKSNDPLRSLPAELPTPVNLITQINDRSVTLSWEVAGGTDVNRYRIYSATPGGQFELLDSATTLSIRLDDLPPNEKIELRVAAVGVSGIEGELSVKVTVLVGLLSVSINSGDQFTKTRSVNLRVIAPSTAAFMMASEDSMFTDGPQLVPVPTLLPFTLSQGDDLKRVYARFSFEDGSESSDPISDAITLDTQARIVSVSYSPPGLTFAADSIIQFILDAGGELGGNASVKFGGVPNISLHDDGLSGDAIADDGIYSIDYLVPVGVTVNNGQLTGNFTDAAGNSATPATSLTPLNIKAVPVPVQLTTVDALSSFQINLVWSASVGSDFASYRVYRDLSSSVDENSTLIMTLSNKSTTTYTDTLDLASTTYYYRVYVVDNSGLSSGSNVSSAATMTNTPPLAVNAAVALFDSTSASLTWTRNDDDDFESYRIFRDTTAGITVADNLIAIITSKATVSFKNFVPFVSGPNPVSAYYYRVFVFDRQSLSTGSNEVTVTR